MLDRIVDYVNYYFPKNKSPCYDDNFIKTCLVYKFLCFNLLRKNINIDDIIIIGNATFPKPPCVKSGVSSILVNHLIFSIAFKEFYKRYHKGRGSVYVFDSPFKDYSTIGFLTGIAYWSFHRGVA